jgi:serine/threonine protein kinase
MEAVGGKLFDEGLYGCLFTPQLDCKPGSRRGSASADKDVLHPPVSKLILTDDAEIEFNISKMIRKIPLWKNYFVVSESICEPALVQKDKDISKCIDNPRDIVKYSILTMPFGGQAMSTFRFNVKGFDFMSFVKHFLECGALLNLFGVVHRDIHQGNILIDNEFVPRIIDFNLAIPVNSDVVVEDLSHKYEYSIAQEPPDSALVNAIAHNYKADKVIHAVTFKRSTMKQIRNLLGITNQAMSDELEEFYTKSKSVKAGDTLGWFKIYWRTIDSWAFGVNLVDLISRLSLWPEFAASWKRSQDKILPILRRLCAVSPVKRIDCVQALNYLDPSSFIIRKYGRAWLAKVGDGKIL